MTDDHTDDIRDLLAHAMSEALEPHPWADVEQRSRQDDALTPKHRRTGLWLATAACTIALVGGLVAVAVVGPDTSPKPGTDDPDSITPAPFTSVPPPTTTTDPRTQLSWSGSLLDDISVDALRPLDGSFNSFEGDLVVPTAPSGWRVENAGSTTDDAWLSPNVSAWFVDVADTTNDDQSGRRIYLRMSQFPVCLGCRPSGDAATINDFTWESVVPDPEADDRFVDAAVLRTRLDNDTWLSLVANSPDHSNGPPLENPVIIEFIEGLRVSSWDELTGMDE